MIGRAAPALILLATLAACSSLEPSTENTATNSAPPAQPAATATPTVLNDADKSGVDAAVDAIYAPYRTAASAEADADWDRPIFSAATRGLIAQWKGLRVNGEIVSSLEEAGWFCQCQDWSGSGFKFLGRTVSPLPDGGVEADIRFDLGDGETLQAHILFVREGTAWNVSDIFTPALPKGLVAQIKDDLATLKKP